LNKSTSFIGKKPRLAEKSHDARFTGPYKDSPWLH
jgi:hypothetical protein